MVEFTGQPLEKELTNLFFSWPNEKFKNQIRGITPMLKELKLRAFY